VRIYSYHIRQANGNYIQSIGDGKNGNIGSTLKSGPIYLQDNVPNDIYFDSPVLTNGFWIYIHTDSADANRGGIIDVQGIWDYDWEHSPASIAFPTTSVGTCTTFGAHKIQITNKSTVTKQFSFSSNNSDFVPSSGTLTVFAGQTGNKPVQFCPSSAGAKSGTITITCTGSCNPSTATVSVSGTGMAQYNWTLLDDSHNFGDVTVGDYSAWYQTGVKNNSSTTLNYIVESDDETHFKVSPSSFTAPPNGWGVFDVRFHPTAQQYYSATLLVTCTTSGANPPEDTMIVSGTGVLPISNCILLFSYNGNGHATCNVPKCLPENLGCDCGTVVTVTAIPDSGWTFSHWSGAVSSEENPLTFALDTDMVVIANFISGGGTSVIGGINFSNSIFYDGFLIGEQNAAIATIELTNTGDLTGIVNTKYFYRLFSDSIWTELTGIFQVIITDGDSILKTHFANIPNFTGEFIFGVKVWGETENEPSLPICIPATKENGRFDVDQDGLVTWKDVFLIGENIVSPTVPYNEYYDMNCDGKVNYYDVLSCNANKDIPATSCEEVPDEPTCTQIGCYWYNGSCHGEPLVTEQIIAIPVGDGDHPSSHSRYGCSADSHYQCVDDLATLTEHDGDTTYLINSFTGGADTDQEKWDRLLINVPAQAGTINSVKTVVTAKRTGSVGNCSLRLGIGTKKVPVEGDGLTTSYADYTVIQTTNPSGNPWQWSDLVNKDIEVDSYIWFGSTGGTQVIRITSVYVIIDYTV
jgi:hypothetical protein